MNYLPFIQQLQQKYPNRPTDSVPLATVFSELQERFTSLGCSSNIQKIAVFHFQTSLLVFIIGGILASVIGGWLPIAGVIITGLLWLGLAFEIIRPTLARLKPRSSQNLQIQLPARGKEFQHIILVTKIDTSAVTPTVGALSTKSYLYLQLGLGLLVVISHKLNFLLNLHSSALWSLLPLGIMLIALVIPKTTNPGSTLANCSILLDLATLLQKAKPFTTSTTVLFTGAGPLHSGILGLAEEIKKNPELTYLVNLIETSHETVQLISSEGRLFPLRSESMLFEIIREIANEKSLAIEVATSPEISNLVPLKLNQVQNITLAIPTNATPEQAKAARELLIGLIRKLDR